MTQLYILSNILANGFLVYLIFRYNALLFKEMRAGSNVTWSIYLIFFAATTLLRFSKIEYFTLWGIDILLYFCLTFVYRAKAPRRIFSAILLYAVQIAVDMGLIALSGHYDLRLYNPPLFSTIAGFLLFDSIIFLLLVAFECLRRLFHTRENLWLYWISTITVPAALLYLLTFAFLADERDLDLAFFVSLFILLILTTALLYLYDKKTKLAKLQLEKDLISQQNEYYTKQFALQQASESYIKTARHDMANHLTAMKSLIERGQRQESHAYLERAMQSLKPSSLISNTGNPVIDGLLNSKLQDCHSQGIHLDFDAAIPASLDFDTFDLTIVLGNLLDNALEAVSKATCTDKRLQVCLSLKHNCLTIRIKNTYDGRLYSNQGRLLTTKKNAQVHGIGLKNVQTITANHDGIFDVTYDSLYFTVSVVLPLAHTTTDG